jgi:predicted NBD/HSP70 family sugar kinase
MPSTQARHWRSAAAALAVLRAVADPTRRELAMALGLDSGPTSDLVQRLRTAGLVTERRAESAGRGRPTSTLHAHPAGPVALCVDLRHSDWRLGRCAVDGTVQLLAAGDHDGQDVLGLIDLLRERVRRAARREGHRVVAIGVAVPGQTDGVTLLHAALLGWRDVDLTVLAPRKGATVVAGNDASMSAVAEARRHRPVPRALLHIVTEIGVNGALVMDGRPITGAHGLHGEFGHLPLGDPTERCPCGARGCWTTAFDARHVARRLGRRTPRDQRAWLARMFAAEHPTAAEQQVREELATSLGRGAAGLVNALDPDLVTLGGLAVPLRRTSRTSFDDAFRAGLMTLHRDRPPEIVAARAGDDAALVGAGLSALDRALDADLLAAWAAGNDEGPR